MFTGIVGPFIGHLGLDSEDKNRIRTINERREERAKRDWEWMLSEPQGRRIIWELLAACGYGEPVIDREPNFTAYNCGRQAVELFIRRKIDEARPEALLKMKQEYESELKSQEKELNEEIENA